MKYVTTAIDYVNSLPHLGTAYEKIGADVYVRWNRMLGQTVRFQMGSDEHSAKVQKAAEEKKLDPKVYCDGMKENFEKAWSALRISHDDFIQTSEPRHHKSVLKFFEKVEAAGDIYQKDYEGWYCESCEAFYLEKDLEEGLCPNHKTKPKKLHENNFFFRLSKYQEALIRHIETNPEFILPAKRRNEVLSFLKQGLEDISISRSTFTWGIPVPRDKGHVFYVWFDALINYITGLGYAENETQFLKDWADTTHIVGKDITRFHCIIWPAMLMSAGLPLPKHVIGHGFVYLRGEKMSKSLGNVVTPMDILKEYPDFGADALRYYLLRTSSFGDDSDFTYDGFIERYNSDLANGYGNLVSRTLGMIHRYQDGVLKPLPNSVLNGEEGSLLKEAETVFEAMTRDFDPVVSGDLNFHSGLEKAMGYLTKIDQYIDRKAPWTLAKESKTDELSVVLTTLIEAIRQVSILLSAVIPGATEKAWCELGFGDQNSFLHLTKESLEAVPYLTSEFKLETKKLMLFPRIEKKEEKVEQPKPEKKTSKTNEAPLIDIEDFLKVDLRVAKILQAERVEGADKLFRLQVELGEEKRQIVAGIAEHYQADDLVGQSVVLVANLKPAKIRGVESHGMLLAAKKGKKLTVVSPLSEIPSNAKVG